MKKTIEDSIKALVLQCERENNATDALKFSQAALNLAHTNSVLTDTALRK